MCCKTDSYVCSDDCSAKPTGQSSPDREACSIFGQRLYRCASGAGAEAVALRNHDDAATGPRKALRICCAIETNPLAGWYGHVLVDNAAVQVRTLFDDDSVEQQRMFDGRSLFDPDAREQDRM